MNKILTMFFCSLLLMPMSFANDLDLLMVGDSQTGATWAKSYIGNFMQQCLKNKFLVIGRGGTTFSSWIGKGNLDQIETILRDPDNQHQNIGKAANLPFHLKRLSPMIEHFKPKRILLFFGDNLIASSDLEIKNQTVMTLSELEKFNFRPEECFFLTPTFEMEVANKRNVPKKDLTNTKRIGRIIADVIREKCQPIDGIELMTNSTYLNNQVLRRVPITDTKDCQGKASNDNIHVCGEAAQDFAQKVCDILN